MIGTLGLLETTGLTPAMVAIDTMLKAAAVKVFQLELNDLSGVCVKMTGPTAAVQLAIAVGRSVAEQMQGHPIASILTQVSPSAAQLFAGKRSSAPSSNRRSCFRLTKPRPSTQHPVMPISPYPLL